jgi:DNA-binding transcriptional LysR family regulator
MDFRQLEYFRAVVDAGSVSQAAKQLGLTQPPVSTAISKLERDLGVRLLERTSKGVQPTSAGLLLLREGNRMLSERVRLRRTLSMMGDGVVGQLRIGAEPMVIHEFIADVLSEFMEEAPDVHISLTDATPDAILRGIRAGELDMGCLPFGPDQFTSVVSDFCDFLQVGVIPVKLAVPRRRFLEHHPDGHGWGRWIVPYPLPAFYGFPDAVEKELAGVDETFQTIEVSTPQTSVGFVAAGLGVALVTERMAEHYPGVALLEPPDWVPTMGATLLWRRGAEVTPLMERWISSTKGVLAPS